jgi:hypothetical protein
MIEVDGGSVDPGPHYLGFGKPFCSTMAIRMIDKSSAACSTRTC